jgi:thiol:disulfide interchange protein DsbD
MKRFWSDGTRAARFAALGLMAAAMGSAVSSFAQSGGGIPAASTLVKATAAPARIAVGGRGEAVVTLSVLPGWHINANPPSLDYMIPTEVKLDAAHGVRAGRPVYPTPHKEKLSFEDSELLVYDAESQVRIPLEASMARPGTYTMTGQVAYQACNDQVCLAPTRVPFTLELVVTETPSGAASSAATSPEGGAGSTPGTGSAPGTGSTPGAGSTAGADTGASAAPGPGVSPTAGSTPSGSGFTTVPPAGAGAAAPVATGNSIADLFARGSFAAFAGLFLIGLALNLTPCVYPMLGVTVSIFGARRAAPTAQVIGYAILYVLGIALMYSTLGLVAAFTGGLFGAFLQNPLVLAGIGLLFIVLSLSMFGLYEVQVPPALLEKLGGSGATSAVGVFVSGLVVGIFAAPCVGPPIVALLALVGAKGDPWFGFLSFFVLALGLGAPYLVLATSSSLLQRMPRSGDWMVWVKKVFGVILVGVGAFYVLLGFAPEYAPWVMPAALILGGLYLGFVEKSASGRPGFSRFKTLAGAAAVIGGLVFVVTTPKQGLAFRAFSPEELQATFASGKPAMLDFSAAWCVPCHELDRATFTDRGVIAAARPFHAYKVDLTHYDSPEAERWRREYNVTGVPTVVFLDPTGREIPGTRVEGFMPPGPFLARMRAATEAADATSMRVE